ncbi:phosphohydrolase [Lysobacter koreensis]|uniref:Phosphohydrolase n=1 Tax=Lysobacter koreensis TaxID=266122 RepID=A0ABW2YIV1_9GAMM
MSIVAKARELAHRAHAGQVDKAGRPYIEHVARVAAAVADDSEAEAVAWLHDVLEDAPDYWAEVTRTVYQRQQAAIVALSRTPFKLTASAYYAGIRANPLALRVKLADIADNANEGRLALLDAATAARLRRKYAKAIAALTDDREVRRGG